MNKLEALKQNVETARNNLDKAEYDLREFELSAENNIYETVGEALSNIEDKLIEQIRDICSEENCCGDMEYTVKFLVNNEEYEFILYVYYGRYDKRFYFIDSYKASYKKL